MTGRSLRIGMLERVGVACAFPVAVVAVVLVSPLLALWAARDWIAGRTRQFPGGCRVCTQQKER